MRPIPSTTATDICSLISWSRTTAAYYITGGKAIPVTWSKGHDMDPMRFYDADGNLITLNTGKTYVALVSDSRWDELVVK